MLKESERVRPTELKGLPFRFFMPDEAMFLRWIKRCIDFPFGIRAFRLRDLGHLGECEYCLFGGLTTHPQWM